MLRQLPAVVYCTTLGDCCAAYKLHGGYTSSPVVVLAPRAITERERTVDPKDAVVDWIDRSVAVHAERNGAFHMGIGIVLAGSVMVAVRNRLMRRQPPGP
jgi:hypothetical protein